MSRGVRPIAAKFAMSASAVDKEEGSRAAAWSALDTIPSRRPSSTTQDGPPCCKQYNIIIVHYVFKKIMSAWWSHWWNSDILDLIRRITTAGYDWQKLELKLGSLVPPRKRINWTLCETLVPDYSLFGMTRTCNRRTWKSNEKSGDRPWHNWALPSYVLVSKALEKLFPLPNKLASLSSSCVWQLHERLIIELRYLILTGHLYVSGMWCGVNLRTGTK